MWTGQFGYRWRTWVVCGPCMWVPGIVIMFSMCHKYHVKHTSKHGNLDRLKSGSKRDTNETPICAVPMHAPQTNALWWGEMGGTTKAIVYTLARGVGIGCLQVLMEWVEWMWRVALSLLTVGTSPGVRAGQAVYSQNRDGYEVEQCGQAGSRSNCGCMQVCCVGARPGVRSWRTMVQVAVSTKTNRVGAAARHS